jgi:malonyl CoA-acyl carrier protein transacylase
VHSCESRIPLVNNVDVRIESDPERIKDALVRQAASPVRWAETIRAMAAQGVTHIVECGPGKVLAGWSSASTRTCRASPRRIAPRSSPRSPQ